MIKLLFIILGLMFTIPANAADVVVYDTNTNAVISYLKSVNTPSYQGRPDVLINPVIPDTALKYLKVVGSEVQEMSQSEKDAVDKAIQDIANQAELDSITAGEITASQLFEGLKALGTVENAQITAQIKENEGLRTVLRVAGASGSAGQSGVNVGVSLATSALDNGICSLNLDISYNAGVLSVADVVAGVEAIAAGKSVSYSEPETGVVRLVIFGLNQTAIADGEIAVVSFDVKAIPSASNSALSISKQTASDKDANPVVMEIEDAVFTVN